MIDVETRVLTEGDAAAYWNLRLEALEQEPAVVCRVRRGAPRNPDRVGRRAPASDGRTPALF